MKLTDQAKRDILNLVLGVTADIADKEYQKRVWIRGKGPECDSYEDAIWNFHEGDGVLKKYKDFGLSDSQYQILKNFRAEFKVFYKKNDCPDEFIDSPEWARIMEMAKEVLKAFDYQKSR